MDKNPADNLEIMYYKNIDTPESASINSTNKNY